MSHEAELTYKPYRPEDLPFIFDSWGSSYYPGSSAAKAMSAGQFHSFHRPIRERVLAKSNLSILVCCSIEDPWHILGWIAYETHPDLFILHYVYVKNTFRHEGIGKELLTHVLSEHSIIAMTHLTFTGAKIMAAHSALFNRFKYVPHAV